MIALLAALSAHAEPVWPMDSGIHEVLHSYQNPFSFLWYFHEGVDLRGHGHQVVAARSGTVRYRQQWDSGGTLGIVVSTPTGQEFDSYLHIDIGAWNVGDPITAGDVIGTVSTTYFYDDIQNHVHVNRFDGWAGGNGYTGSRSNMLDPLAIYPDPADRDPQGLPAAPDDADGDGETLLVVDADMRSRAFDFAFKDVDLLVEATDVQSSTLNYGQGVAGVGYWIESPTGLHDVRGAADPYVLVWFGDAWRGSCGGNCDNILFNVMDPYRVVEYHGTDTGWAMCANYTVTNASGTLGRGTDVDTDEHWATDARVGTFTRPNGSDGLRAREIGEAAFPDGVYRVHALVADRLATTDTAYDVVVDNFLPYVAAASVGNAGAAPAYAASWLFDPAAVELQLTATEDPAGVDVGADVVVDLTFSEPVTEAEVVEIDPPLAVLPLLTASDATGLHWRAVLPVGTLDPAGADHGLHTLHVRARDTNGTTITPLVDGLSVPAPFNRRASAAPIVDPAARDTVHRFRVGRFGDLDRSGVVDAADVPLFQRQLNGLDPYDPAADADGDGVVDDTDLAAALAWYGG